MLDNECAALRPRLQELASNGTRLGQLSPGEGAQTLDQMTQKLNRRFDAVLEQVLFSSKNLGDGARDEVVAVAGRNP